MHFTLVAAMVAGIASIPWCYTKLNFYWKRIWFVTFLCYFLGLSLYFWKNYGTMLEFKMMLYDSYLDMVLDSPVYMFKPLIVFMVLINCTLSYAYVDNKHLNPKCDVHKHRTKGRRKTRVRQIVVLAALAAFAVFA